MSNDRYDEQLCCPFCKGTVKGATFELRCLWENVDIYIGNGDFDLICNDCGTKAPGKEWVRNDHD